MMNDKHSLALPLFALLIMVTFPLSALFISTHEGLKPYYSKKDVVLIASPGRSGSTMMNQCMLKYASSRYSVLKTHLLPPSKRFKGKIIFIFSNPDKAAESVLHRMMTRVKFGGLHFSHLETADLDWWKNIGENAQNQTLENNLLSYDAFGCYEQLNGWLLEQVRPCDPDDAQILAIKYEHLWEKETVNAIRQFLNLKSFELPAYAPRGYDKNELTEKEIAFRDALNLGTRERPRYAAYDRAREVWHEARPIQFLKINAL